MHFRRMTDNRMVQENGPKNRCTKHSSGKDWAKCDQKKGDGRGVGWIMCSGTVDSTLSTTDKQQYKSTNTEK